MSTELQIIDTSMLSKEQMDALKLAVLGSGQTCTAVELELCIAICNQVGLSPFSSHVCIIKGRTAFRIDGLRSLAERTGQYRGQTPTYFLTEAGEWVDAWVSATPPLAAKVGIYRAGFVEPLFGVASFKEFDKKVQNWGTMPSHMIAKCAEAIALRKAFPLQLGGLYSIEEMEGIPVASTPTPYAPLAFKAAHKELGVWIAEAKAKGHISENEVETYRPKYKACTTINQLVELKAEIQESITFNQETQND